MHSVRLKHVIGVFAQFLTPGRNSNNRYSGAALLLALLSFHPALMWAAPAVTLTSANPGANFGSAPVGATSTTNVTLTFTFTSSGSISAPVVLTQGAANRDFTDNGSGSCTTNGTAHVYSVNDTCTVMIDFTPTAVGLRIGAVQLYSSGVPIATAPVYGVGTGPLAQFPGGGVQSSLGSGFTLPGAVAVDGAGDVFLAELSGLTGSIMEIKAGGTVQPIVTGLLNPSFGIAVDGAGNLYYTDFANNAVKEVVATNGIVNSSSTVIAVGPTITAPGGLAIDGRGDLFVTNGLTVYEIAAVNGTPGSTAATVGSGWIAPFGVAVDSGGNLFVTDDGNILNPNAGTVEEVVPTGGVFNSSSTVKTVAQNLNSPGGLALDAAGNIYVGDTGDGMLKEFIATGGLVNTSSLSQSLGTGFTGPTAVASDGKGNLYVSDGNLTSIVQLALTTPPALTFASTATGNTSTDSPQKVTLQNAGNDTMSVSVPSPTTSSFLLDNSATNCSSTMQSSSTCTIGIDFAPQSTGSLSANEIVTDDSLNVANSIQTIALSGTATPGATGTVTSATAATATYNPSAQTVALSATVTAGSNPATTGTVTFTVKSGATVIGTATTSGTLNASGSASVVYPLPAGTQAGAYTIDAAYNGGTGFAASSDTSHQLTIGRATPTVSTAPSATAITYGQTLANSALSGGAASYNSTAVAGSFAFTTPAIAPNVGTPSENVTFTPTDGTDYNTAPGTATVTVNMAAATVVITGYTVPYNGAAHTATGTATGIGGANLSADLTLTGTTHTNAGVYSSDSWSFTDPNGNYAPKTGTVTDTITPIAPTLGISGLPGIAYQGGSFTPTVAYNGDGTASVTSQTPSVCTVSSGVVSFVSSGTCTLTSSATAGANYVAASGAAQSFWIGPSEPVGSTTSTLTATVTITTGGTLGQINVLTQGAANMDFAYVSGGTCATGTAYTANQTCTVEFTFMPSRPGQRTGAISLTTGSSSSATVLGTALVYGMGTGPLVAFPGAASSKVLSQFEVPSSVAVDASGDVYVTDKGSSQVKEIVAVNGVIPPSPTIRILGSGFNQPFGVAVDAIGNVYVADFQIGVKEIEAVNGVIPASPTILTLGSGFSGPSGVAVDAGGNVYVTDAGNRAVKEIEAVNGVIPASPTIRTLGSGFNEPYGVAVDASGNVYVSDFLNNAVKEIVAVNGIVPSSPTIRTLGSGFSQPEGVAVDASGNVYVADSLNNAVKEIVAVNGVIPASPTILNMGSSLGLQMPFGVALDGGGHVYVSHMGSASTPLPAVEEIDLTQPPALTFASTAVGQTSSDSPKSVMVQNDGNAALFFGSIAGSPNFTVSNTGTCSTSTPLAESGTCTVAASFAPIAAGSPDTGTIALNDTSLNATGATQIVNLSGTATDGTTTTISASAASATYSPSAQTVALSAAVMAGSNPVTTGTVTFTVKNGSTVIGSATTSSALTSSGAASVSYTLPAATPAGSYTIDAVYNAGPGYATSSDTTHQLIVSQVLPTLTLSGIPAIAYQGGSFTPTLSYNGDGTASVTSQTTSVCTVSSGVVSFVSGGTCTLTPSATPGAIYAAASGAAQSFWIGPSESVGSTTSTLTATVTITTGGTLGQINVLTQGAPNMDFAYVTGGTCATGTAYTANQTCTVEFTFTPSRPGQRMGAISLTTGSSSSATVLGTALVYGMGIGPLAAFPGTGSLQEFAQGISPSSVVVDAAGNLYVTESQLGQVFEYQAVNGIIPASPTRILGSGFGMPSGVAVDGGGNVYVADVYKNEVTEIVAVNGVIPASPTMVTLGSGFNSPDGVAVDASGNVYVADNGNNAVKEIVAVNGVIPASPTTVTLSSGFNSPSGVAVDGGGNVYVADTGHNAVKEIEAVNGVIPASPTIRTLGSGSYPYMVAVDAGGNVYFADQSITAVKEIVAVNGIIPSSPAVLTPGGGLTFSHVGGLAVDGSGHLYVGVPSSSTGVIEIDLTQPPPLTFASTAVGQTSTDSPQSVTIENDGNAALAFSSITTSTNFALSNTGTCSTSTPLAESGTCTVAASFTPAAAGSPDAGTITLTDNNLNATGATQTVSLSGTGTGGTTTTVSARAASATYSPSSQTVALLATVMAGSNPATTGTVTFTVKSGSSVIGSATTSGTLSSSGAATVSYTLPAGTAAGTYTIQAAYNPGAGYVGSTDTSHTLIIAKATPTITTVPTASAINYGQTLASATLTGGVAQLGSTAVTGTFAFTTPTTVPGGGKSSQSITFTPTDSTNEMPATGAVNVTVNQATPTVTLTSSTNPAIVTGTVTFTVTVSATTGTPGGSVSFYDGSTLLGSVPLLNGTTAYTTSSLAIGSHSITAVYSGDVDYVSVTSSQIVEVIQDFTFSSSSPSGGTPSQTVAPGGTAKFTLNIAPSGSTFPAPVTLSASGLPQGATATLSPSTLPAGSSLSSVTLTIQLPQQTAQLKRNSGPFRNEAPLFLGMLLLPFARKLRRHGKRLRRMLLLLLVLTAGAVGLAGLNGCGASTGYFAQAPQTYTITVNATCLGVTRSTTVSLTVE